MELRWVSQGDADEPAFDNDASPYAHYWLSLLPAAGEQSRRRSIVDQTARLARTTEDLIGRGFFR